MTAKHRMTGIRWALSEHALTPYWRVRIALRFARAYLICWRKGHVWRRRLDGTNGCLRCDWTAR